MFWRKKKNKKQYSCSQCGEVHQQWPALAFVSPENYHNLSKSQKKEIATLSDDFCIIQYETETNYFIRVVLKQKIIDYDVFLEYGLWVSLSEKSFRDYSDNFKNKQHETGYFGWLCNELPAYENMINIPMNVLIKKGNKRPEIFPHDDFEHPFVKDFYNGITNAEAEHRIHAMYDALK
ncbi:DUF2199 domain-containing protein [Kordia algicida OT-1]|uniref:DUF2199 domain-containing protein n=1 Tax=Kordia algicida OT-1 TaxID=391587 RepID=A9E4N3_9FLAO|nr:DUF2199 domain-containing protein [Kordia algicida]EDP95110.1 hypothetical protein KAOT1_06492 [Kordia algicida OT-1]